MAALGIRDMVAVETNDAILITSWISPQEVKSLVNLIKQKDIPRGQRTQKNL